jgi:hypothetical protein
MNFHEVEEQLRREREARQRPPGPPTIGVIVASYNRPQMLRQALASVLIQNPDQVILCDDGSDLFDPEAVLAEFPWKCPAGVLKSSQRTPEARVTENHICELINTALGKLATEWVAYLCDDDMFAPGWFHIARQYIERNRPQKLWIGQFYQHSVEVPGWPCENDLTFPYYRDPSGMTTGSFIHHRSIKVQWPVGAVTNQDAFVVGQILTQAGKTAVSCQVPATALWWRKHNNNLSWVTKHGGSTLTPEGLDALKKGARE